MDLGHRFEEQAQYRDREGVHRLAFELAEVALELTSNRYIRNVIEDFLPLLRRYSFMALREETTGLETALQCMRGTIAALAERGSARRPGDCATMLPTRRRWC